MSYHRACEAAPTSGTAPVTVCTNHLALCNLVEHALPLAVPQSGGDSEFLVAQMVELEHYGIGLAAVNARVLAQKHDEKLDPLRHQDPLPRPAWSM